MAVREADGTNSESSPRTDPGPSVARIRPCLRTSTLPSRMAATPFAGSPSRKSVEPVAASLIVISRLSWSMSSSMTSRNGHTARIAAGRSAFKRVLRNCRRDRRERPRTGKGRVVKQHVNPDPSGVNRLGLLETQRGELSHRGARPVFAVLADRGMPASPEPLPSGRDPCRQGSTEAEPVLEGAQRVQPDMRHDLVATPSHLWTFCYSSSRECPPGSGIRRVENVRIPCQEGEHPRMVTLERSQPHEGSGLGSRADGRW